MFKSPLLDPSFELRRLCSPASSRESVNRRLVHAAVARLLVLFCCFSVVGSAQVPQVKDITETSAVIYLEWSGAFPTYARVEYTDDPNSETPLGSAQSFAQHLPTGFSRVMLSATGLTPGTVYYYRGHVFTPGDPGPSGGWFSFFTTLGTPQPGLPTAVTGPVTDRSETSATITGVVNPRGVDTVAHFEFGLMPQLGLEFRGPALSLGGGTEPLSLSLPMTGLEEGTTYFYRVLATNSFGSRLGQVSSFTTTPVLSIATLPAENITENAAQLHGIVDANGKPASAYFLYGKVGAGVSGTNSQAIAANTEAFAFSTTVADLEQGTTYEFRAVAVKHDIFQGEKLTFTTPVAPPGVALPEVSGVNATGALLSAVIVPGAADAVAWFEYGTSPVLAAATTSSPQSVAAGESSTIFHQLMGLKAGTEYFFRAVASNVHGTRKSAIISFFAAEGALPFVRIRHATGQTISGEPGGIISEFGAPWQSGDGRDLGFWCVIRGVDGQRQQAIVLSSEGNLRIKARQGGAVPGVPGAVFGRLDDPVFGKAQKLAFVGSIRGQGVSTTNNQGLWSNFGTEELHLLARKGAPAPGIPNSRFVSFVSVAMLDDPAENEPQGAIVIANLRTLGGRRKSLWIESALAAGPTLQLLALEGTAVVGSSRNVPIEEFTLLGSVPGSTGAERQRSGSGLVVRFTYAGGDQEIGLIRASGENVLFTPIVWTGATALLRGISGALPLSTFGVPGNAGAGTWFSARVHDRVHRNTEGIAFSSAYSPPMIIYRAGDSIEGWRLVSFADPVPSGSRAAVVAQIASANGTKTRSALWLISQWESAAIVATVGDGLPGSEASILAKILSVAMFADPARRGPAFTGKLGPIGRFDTAGQGSSTDDRGLWVRTSDGQLKLVARTGNPIGGKVVRKLIALESVPGSPGESRSANAFQHLVFRVIFVDGTQAIVQALVP